VGRVLRTTARDGEAWFAEIDATTPRRLRQREREVAVPPDIEGALAVCGHEPRGASRAVQPEALGGH